MNIGFVSTWFERGAAYVTKSYVELLKDKHNVMVYARGGERFAKGDPEWDMPYVTWSPKLLGTNINYSHIKKWLTENNIEVLFFNEQNEIDIVYRIKKNFPDIKLGSYIDYYKENTVKEFFIYDFLICNTKRHFSVFKDHPQCFYVPWGTNVGLFKPGKKRDAELTFFHSAGMSNRKGTTYAIDAFLDGEIYKKAKLIVHSQRNFEESFGYKTDILKRHNIEVIESTVSSPGLYHLGDIYVYPTMLDGLGLTMYEALSVGLPVIATDHPPMNEVINNEVGYLVEVDYLRSRHDGYYWPLSIIKKESLIKGMKYFVDHPEEVSRMKKNARKEAVEKWSWADRRDKINDIFMNAKVIVENPSKELLAQHSKIEMLRRKIGSTMLYGSYLVIREKLR